MSKWFFLYPLGKVIRKDYVLLKLKMEKNKFVKKSHKKIVTFRSPFHFSGKQPQFAPHSKIVPFMVFVSKCQVHHQLDDDKTKKLDLLIVCAQRL